METNIITKIELFDFMRCFFTDDKKYKKLTQAAKKPHFFMWRRMMAIQYPVQMHALSMLDDVRMMDVLHEKFCSPTYPKWMYTSAPSEKKDKDKIIISKFDRKVLDTFMEHYNIEYPSVLIMQEWFPDLLEKEFQKIEDELYPELKKERLKKNAKKSA